MSCNNHCLLLAAFAACVSLAACSDDYLDRREAVSLDAGEAVAADRVTQMIDPWSRASANHNIPGNGQRTQAAMERYRTNKVIAPVSPLTTTAPAQQVIPVVPATPGTKP